MTIHYNIKKIFILFLFFGYICIFPVFVSALEDIKEAKYFCSYNKSGVGDEVDVLVGISADFEEAIAETSVVGEKYISNWKFNDDNWDEDLGVEFSAKKYYESTGKCPKMAYIDEYSYGHDLYLVSSPEQLKDLRGTFFNTLSENSEPYYFLKEKNESKKIDKVCKYEVEAEYIEGTKTKALFELKFNENGKILNTGNILSIRSLDIIISPEIGFSNNYVKDHCPNLHLCEVPEWWFPTASSPTANDFWLYYADYSEESNRNNCQKISCINTDQIYCDPDAEDADICVTFDDLKSEYDSNLELYKENSQNFSKYKQSMDKIKNWCRLVFSNLEHGNPCLNRCLKLDDYIETQESQMQYDDDNCGFSQRLISFIGNILKWVKYIVPVIVIVMGILDFIKALSSDKDDEMKKAQGKFMKRLIAAALVFIIPLILEFVLNKMGFDYNECGLFSSR